jgi:hypothetical protein
MKQPKSKLDPHLERLEHWFGSEHLSLEDAQERLRDLGFNISKPRLSRWWKARQLEIVQNKLLDQIASAARQCQAIEAEFGRNAPPHMHTLINLHRVLVMKLSAQANLAPTLLPLVTNLMRPVLEWARLEEKQKDRRLAEAKFRRRLADQSATRLAEDADSEKALTSETLEKIERDLNLL